MHRPAVATPIIWRILAGSFSPFICVFAPSWNPAIRPLQCTGRSDGNFTSAIDAPFHFQFSQICSVYLLYDRQRIMSTADVVQSSRVLVLTVAYCSVHVLIEPVMLLFCQFWAILWECVSEFAPNRCIVESMRVSSLDYWGSIDFSARCKLFVHKL